MMKKVIVSVIGLVLTSNLMWASYNMATAVPYGSTMVGGRPMNEAVGNAIDPACLVPGVQPQMAPLTQQQFLLEQQRLQAPGSHLYQQPQQMVPRGF